MPDPTFQTVSASQVPALFNQSPYLSRWMLHRNFADRMPIDAPEDNRMRWGRALEPLILEQARRDLSLEIRPDQAYVRAGNLGCTRDAIVIDPSLGPGALETKCVFDYRTFMAEWDGGTRAPKHYEMQLQAQMQVGDGVRPYRWGIIAVWVAGDVKYLRRDPVLDLWERVETEAADFLIDVAARKAPDPLGAAIELPMLTSIVRTGEVLDRRNDVDLAEAARLYEHLAERKRAAERAVDAQKIELLSALGDASEAQCFGGIRIKVRQDRVPEHTRKASTRTILTVKIPDVLPDAIDASFKG